MCLIGTCNLLFVYYRRFSTCALAEMTIVGGGSSNGGEADDELIVFMLDNVQLMAIENDAASEPTPPYRMIIRRFNPKRLAHAKSSVEIKETKGEASVTGRPPQLHKFHRPPAGSGFIQASCYFFGNYH